jgi:hypothetical protein
MGPRTLGLRLNDTPNILWNILKLCTVINNVFKIYIHTLILHDMILSEKPVLVQAILYHKKLFDQFPKYTPYLTKQQTPLSRPAPNTQTLSSCSKSSFKLNPDQTCGPHLSTCPASTDLQTCYYQATCHPTSWDNIHQWAQG